MEIKQEEFAEWRNNPTTRKIFTYLAERREEIKEELATSLLDDMTSMRTATATGACRILKEIIEISYQDISFFYNLENEKTND